MTSILRDEVLRRLKEGGELKGDLPRCYGREIAHLAINNDILVIGFVDQRPIKLWDSGQSCCESRYMNCDDDLQHHVGAQLLDVEIREGPTVDDGDTLECEFLVVTTSKGQFTVANYNHHNGYYGGFDISAEFD